MTSTTPPKLLTIDLDDTLWPCDPPIRLAEARLADWLAGAAPRLALAHDQASLRRHRMGLVRDRPDLAHDVTALRTESLRLLLEDFGYPQSLVHEGIWVFLEARNRVEPYPDVVRVLRDLASRFCLVSVTNGNSDLGQTPLRGIFHHSLTAGAVGAAKPDPALFHEALRLAGVEAGEAIHLGDDPVLDVAAAQAAGLRAVWVNRFGRTWPEGLAPPQVEVSDLDGFYHWLGGQAHAL